MKRLVRYERLVTVTAVYEQDQRDEPPGRGDTKEVETVLAERRDVINEAHIEGAIREVYA